MRIWMSALLLASGTAALAQPPQGYDRHDDGRPPREQAPGQQQDRRGAPPVQQQAPRPDGQPPRGPGQFDARARFGGDQGRGQPGPNGAEGDLRARGAAGGDPAQRPGWGRPGGYDAAQRGAPGYRGPGAYRGQPQPGQSLERGRPDGERTNGRDGRDWHRRDQGGVQVWRGTPGAARPDQPGRPGDDRGRGYGAGRGNEWNRGWRDDRRYDWQGWRDAHRGDYRVGRYAAPRGYGYGYRRYGVGAVLAPAFFAPTYWIVDPGAYRLPPAYGPYRWVRYYGDALLVDIYSGRVVDAIPGFFA